MKPITTADGTQLYVKQWGAGRPVVMAHGWPLSADSFDDLSLALANAGLRAISYDRRGFGRSDQPWTGYDYNTLADDLAAVLEQTDAQDATLLGFSMGGGEVARYLTRHGAEQRVRQAVLVASVVPGLLKTADNPEGVEASVFADMADGIRQDRAQFFAGFFKDFFGVSLLSHPVSMETLQWACNTAMQGGLWPTLACASAFAMTDFRADLAAFTMPTLIIHGSGDKTVPIETSGRRAARAINTAKLIEYEGAPHGLFASHKDRLIADVLAFVRG